jgi:predicted ATP-dependent endonuclease of OLD family
MIKVKEIKIKNFRSIVDMTLDLNNLNILVGLNDSGKSNILKALNLFFNNKTDEDKEFDFGIDYSKFAKRVQKKATEIIVQLKIEIPNGFVDKGDFIWKKTWRSNSKLPHFDSLEERLQNKKVFSSWSKAPDYLKKIQYTYVPATKSTEYFERLLDDLYAVISTDAESSINKKTIEYSSAVQEFTKGISDTIQKTIGINSTMTMPPHQLDVFRLFTFKTQDDNNDVYLEQRGDGIKARHIPAILKYISEYKARLYKNTAVKSETIWGYEEPETGIELSKCYEFCKEFLRYSDTIQVLLTTHSPAFYSLDGEKNTKIFYVSKNEQTHQTNAIDKIEQKDLHEKFGLMPLIAPFLKSKEDEIAELKHLRDKLFLLDMPTIFVEGNTDKNTLEYIISKKNTQLHNAIANNKLRILTDKSCGTNQLSKWVQAWIVSGFNSKLYVLLDCDESGIKVHNEIHSLDKSNKKIKNQYLKRSNEIQNNFYKNKIIKGNFPFELEHLYPCYFWKIIMAKGYTQPRSTQILLNIILPVMTNDESLEVKLQQVVPNDDFRETIFKNEPRSDTKDSIFKEAKSIYENDERSDIFDGFIPTVEDIANYFSDIM